MVNVSVPDEAQTPPSTMPPREPAPPTPIEQIPKEGVTAGDLAMHAVPDPKSDPYGYLLFVLDGMNNGIQKRLDDQGKAIINMAEKVYGPQGSVGQAAQSGSPVGPAGFNVGSIPQIIHDLKDMLGGGQDPMNAYFAQMGKTFFDKTLETTMRSVTRQLGSQTAGSITHVG